MVRIVLAEDEDILLRSLALKIQRLWPQAQIVAQCSDGESALEAMLTHQPDVAFLDIQMGQLSGLEVAQFMRNHCKLVLVTAYEQYAIPAFDTGVVDYLLKPYSDQRLLQCIQRLQQVLALPAPPPIAPIQRLKLQSGYKMWLQPVAEVSYFRACGRYLEVVTPQRVALLRQSMKCLLAELDPADFWQIHRSYIINVRQLVHVRMQDPDQWWAQLQHQPQPLPISRSYQHLFRLQGRKAGDDAE